MKWLCGKLSSLSEGQDTLKRVCVLKWSCVPECPAVFLRNSLLYPLCSVTPQNISHDFLSDSGIVVLRSHLGNIFLNFHCESFARREKLSHEHCSVSCPSCNNAGAQIEISVLLRIRVHDLDTPCLCEKFLSLSCGEVSKYASSFRGVEDYQDYIVKCIARTRAAHIQDRECDSCNTARGSVAICNILTCSPGEEEK